MWRWSTPENSFLAFIDELWKTKKIRILNKWNKIAGDIIILHMCTKNHNHMRYSSWDMEWEFFFGHFGPIFALYLRPPLTTQITKIFKEWKKHLLEISFWTCATKNTIKWCMLTQVWSATDISFSHFRPFFAFLPHYWPQN